MSRSFAQLSLDRHASNAVNASRWRINLIYIFIYEMPWIVLDFSLFSCQDNSCGIAKYILLSIKYFFSSASHSFWDILHLEEACVCILREKFKPQMRVKFRRCVFYILLLVNIPRVNIHFALFKCDTNAQTTS